jgi:hypothetical protein
VGILPDDLTDANLCTDANRIFPVHNSVNGYLRS